MDERQRLLERAFSREGAGEAYEDHRDPTTGETVRMTPSQWALAEYDRRHDSLRGDGDGDGDSSGSGASRELPSDVDQDRATRATGIRHETLPADDLESGSRPPARRLRMALPILAAVGGLALGAVVTLGIQGVAESARSQSNAAGPSSLKAAGNGDAVSVGPGDGDEGATLAAVSNYFASAPRAYDLPAEVTQGFDPTTFHEVAGTVTMREGSAIYAARRLDDTYCLVAVTRGERAAEACGTMDDLARRGLTLTKDAVRDIDGRPVSITVAWQTDGTISWAAVPSAG